MTLENTICEILIKHFACQRDCQGTFRDGRGGQMVDFCSTVKEIIRATEVTT